MTATPPAKRGRLVTRPLKPPQNENYNRESYKMLTSETEITSKIDWLSVTTPTRDYAPDWTKERKEMTRGMLNYDTGVIYRDGRIELCSSTRPDMKNHIIFDGQTIDFLCRTHGIISTDILKAMANGKPSRLDLAVDIKHGTLPIEEIAQSFEDGKSNTKVEQGLYIRGVGIDGETFYIGSKAAKRRVRIYDKAAENGIVEFDWTRVEMQLRHGMAVRSFWRLIKSQNPIVEIPKLILDFVDFPEIPDWIIAMGTDKIKPCSAEETQSNREQWLLDTAAKALANEMSIGGKGYMLLDEFIQTVRLQYVAKDSKFRM